MEACLPHAAPLDAIRIIDDTRRLLRAPEVCFAAAEIGLDAFGYNIENRHLIAALQARAAELKIPRIAAPALAVASDDAGVTIKLADGSARVRLVDRRRRAALAVPRGGRDRHAIAAAYPQTALTLNLAPCPAASRCDDGIPHRERTVHARAAARPPLEPCLRA